MGILGAGGHAYIMDMQIHAEIVEMYADTYAWMRVYMFHISLMCRCICICRCVGILLCRCMDICVVCMCMCRRVRVRCVGILLCRLVETEFLLAWWCFKSEPMACLYFLFTTVTRFLL